MIGCLLSVVRYYKALSFTTFVCVRVLINLDSVYRGGETFEPKIKYDMGIITFEIEIQTRLKVHLHKFSLVVVI